MIKFNHSLCLSFGLAVLSTGLYSLAAQAADPAQNPGPAMTQSFLFSGAKGTGTTVSDAPYDAATGYGFMSIPNGNESAFAVKAAPGDYRVTVTLGNAKAASRTTVWAEDRRLMLAPVVLKKGEVKTYSFLVNVRDAALKISEQDNTQTPRVGLRGDEAGGRTWDDRLTIAVSGPAPALQKIDVTSVAVRRILIAGDSTVTDQAGGDYASWGQMLPRFLSSDIAIANHARSGETMKSFLTTLRWDKLISETRPGDIVLIQFGHNDEKKQWPRTYAAADGAYPAWLSALVADVRQHGASPVVITPPARKTFKDGKIENSHAGYDDAVRRVAQQLNVPLIDLTAKTAQMYEALGPDLSSEAFANHGQEKTHHNAYGAWMIACFVAHDLTGFGLGVTGAPGAPACDPAHPVDPKTFEITAADWPIMRADIVQKAEPVPLK